jgi:hypothetical protein
MMYRTAFSLSAIFSGAEYVDRLHWFMSESSDAENFAPMLRMRITA